ncbi:MAG: hypothetical protein HY606_08310 [Planctomycetes bacterium]|nr:hypothetical protein [Planctomycetota bacterium]
MKIRKNSAVDESALQKKQIIPPVFKVNFDALKVIVSWDLEVFNVLPSIRAVKKLDSNLARKPAVLFKDMN